MTNIAQHVGYRVGAFLGPMCFLLGFQLVMAEPSGAHANERSVEFLELPDMDGIESKSTDTDRDSDLTSNVESPFWYQEVELSLPELPKIERQVDAVDERVDPTFVLSAVLPSANNSFAVINGKPYTVDDEVAAGWTLQKISGKDRYVILIHESGRRVRVMIQRNRVNKAGEQLSELKSPNAMTSILSLGV